MKIYFAGSIRGGRLDAALYADLIAYLNTFGQVLTEHVGDPNLSAKGDDGPHDRYIFDRDMAWLQASDLVVAEVTTPSLGVGYEVGTAVAWGKPVLCLFRCDAQCHLSAMIQGDPAIETAWYADLAEARNHLAAFIRKQARDLGLSSNPVDHEP